MKNNMEKKILLSKTLEDIEVNRDSSKVISMLDKYHANARSHVLGITGPPGAGKSSLIDKLIFKIRQKKKTVGVIAIDPSSSRTGGALLGDRTRFLLDPKDDDIFVRSMAAKDFLGGLSELTFPTMTVMRSIFDFVIIETVGVGQSETNVKDVVDSVILCVQPGSGDTIQFMKSGIFEIPDIIVVTKSDIEKILYSTDRKILKDMAKLSWALSNNRVTNKSWKTVLSQIDKVEIPIFPLKAKDILDCGLEEGPIIGEILKTMEKDWIDSNFEQNKEDLLFKLKAIINRKKHNN